MHTALQCSKCLPVLIHFMLPFMRKVLITPISRTEKLRLITVWSFAQRHTGREVAELGPEPSQQSQTQLTANRKQTSQKLEKTFQKLV